MSLSSSRISIGGMHCAACSARIERVASRMEGMREAAVNLGTGEGRFVFDPALLSLRTLREAIQNAGFNAKVESVKKNIIGNKSLASIPKTPRIGIKLRLLYQQF